MSERSRAADVIAVGFDGTEVSEELTSFVARTPPAGFVLFGRNVGSLGHVRTLTDALRGLYLERSPLVAVDQEGGRVARLRDGVEPIPSAMAMAAADDENLVERAGTQLGSDLRRAGINLNFAPVLDLATQPGNVVIGTRSFGDDPPRVVQFASAFADGLRASGVVATFKHFPGHGSTSVDSHFELPVVELAGATLRERDLAPFEALLPGARATMTAHIVVRAYDSRSPATASYAVLTELLRRSFRFAGVCFTDCMQMKAIAAGVGTVEGAVAALAAGADCVLISHSLEVAREIIVAIDRALSDGSLSAERFEQACGRMRALRASASTPLPLDAPAPHGGIGREIARRSITRVRGDWRADPAASVAIVFEGDPSGAEDATQSRLATFAPAVQEMRLPLDPEPVRVEQVLLAIKDLQRKPIVLIQRAHLHQNQAHAVERLLEDHPEALLVSTREPFDVLRFEQARHVLAAYGSDVAALAGLSDVVFGGCEPVGRLPVTPA